MKYLSSALQCVCVVQCLYCQHKMCAHRAALSFSVTGLLVKSLTFSFQNCNVDWLLFNQFHTFPQISPIKVEKALAVPTVNRLLRFENRILLCFGKNRYIRFNGRKSLRGKSRQNSSRQRENIVWLRNLKYLKKQNHIHSNGFTVQISLSKPLGWDGRWG